MDKVYKTEEISCILSASLRKVLHNAVWQDFNKLQEIRLRAGEPLLVVYDGREYFLEAGGALSKNRQKAFIVTREDIRESMEYVSNFSMYAFEEELRQGYITVRGGHRVGVAGRMIWDRDVTRSLRHISFMNIRIAHEIQGCGDGVLPYLLQNGELHHTLIISPPRCGKTTLLRDLIRQLSNGDNGRYGMTVGVVDERSELGACYLGIPQNDLGCRTDILDGCPKAEGMMMLVRSMAPQVIAVDEIGSQADVEAIKYVMNSGIRLLATVHGNTIDDIKSKPVLGRMVREKQFGRYVLLAAKETGRIDSIFDERGSLLLSDHWHKSHGKKAAC